MKRSKKNHNHRTLPTNDYRKKNKHTTTVITHITNQQKANQPAPSKVPSYPFPCPPLPPSPTPHPFSQRGDHNARLSIIWQLTGQTTRKKKKKKLAASSHAHKKKTTKKNEQHQNEDWSHCAAMYKMVFDKSLLDVHAMRIHFFTRDPK